MAPAEEQHRGSGDGGTHRPVSARARQLSESTRGSLQPGRQASRCSTCLAGTFVW